MSNYPARFYLLNVSAVSTRLYPEYHVRGTTIPTKKTLSLAPDREGTGMKTAFLL